MTLDYKRRIQHALSRALDVDAGARCPPTLLEAMRHGVLSGGGRVRPILCMAVALAEGGDDWPLTEAAAVAVELLHCASLVHDDLPCFDDAQYRRGQPTVHALYGEPTAILVGDALIVRAFEVIAEAPTLHPRRAMTVLRALSAGVGAPGGIVAGQAWESEATVDLMAYHQAKTAALFEATVIAGAAAAGKETERWRHLGTRLGEAYQVADDLADVLSSPEITGKPTGQDTAHHRPSAVDSLGVEGAMARMSQLVEATIEAVPDCPGRAELVQLVINIAERLYPQRSAALAAG